MIFLDGYNYLNQLYELYAAVPEANLRTTITFYRIYIAMRM